MPNAKKKENQEENLPIPHIPNQIKVVVEEAPLEAPLNSPEVVVDEDESLNKKIQFPLKDKISRETVIILYYLANVSVLGFAIFNYYSLIKDYIDFGGFESLVTFMAFIAILYYLAVRFFDIYIDRCRKIAHLAVLFLIPSTFFELSMDTYFDYSYAVSGFDKWFLYYHQGLAAYNFKKDKMATSLLKVSLEGLSLSGKNDPKNYLAMKSYTYLMLIKGRNANPEENKKLLSQYQVIWNKFSKENPVQEILFLSLDMIRLNRELGNAKNQRQLLQKIREWRKQVVEIPRAFDYDLVFEKLMYEWSDVDKSMGLTPTHEDDFFTPESFQRWELFLRYILNEQLPKVKDKLAQKKEIHKLLTLTSILQKKGQTDRALDDFLRILSWLRTSQLTEETAHVYSSIAEIYELKGAKEKAEVYRQLLIPLQ